MVKVVVRLSPLAKIAATVALLGGGLAGWGKLKGAPWAGGLGTVMLFGGVLVYYVERFRMFRGRSGHRPPDADRDRPLGPRHED